MVCSCDCPGGTIGGANRPVLVESRSSLDGGFICTRIFVDVIGASVTCDGTFEYGASAGVVCAIRFSNVKFNERIGRPSVYGEVGVAVRFICAAVVDDPAIQSGVSRESRGKENCRTIQYLGLSYIGPPGFHPFPPTKLPFPDQFTLYSPPAPLVYVTSAPPSVQKE